MGTLVAGPVEPHDALVDSIKAEMNQRDKVRGYVVVAGEGQ